MRNISDTIARLAAMKRSRPNLQSAGALGRLSEFYDFGVNPGELRARIYLPPNVAPGAPLVVVLHGCTQTAAGYDRGSGWSRLADRQGFALLFPEQRRENNPNLCFNWFVPQDIARGSGEAASIAQMIRTLVREHQLDPQRVFITGLSAGGAMTAALLATYPELFAAGAIVAGLPYASASSVPEAFDRMRGHGLPPAAELEASLASASAHVGHAPRLSIWHGDADRTVDPVNAEAIATQWIRKLGVIGQPTTAAKGPLTRTVWFDAAGNEVMELNRIAGMGHGLPLDPARDGSVTMPFMLDVGISSTLEIAASFGLAENAQPLATQPNVASRQSSLPAPAAIRTRQEAPGRRAAAGAQSARQFDIAKTINDALRSAGLLR